MAGLGEGEKETGYSDGEGIETEWRVDSSYVLATR